MTRQRQTSILADKNLDQTTAQTRRIVVILRSVNWQQSQSEQPVFRPLGNPGTSSPCGAFLGILGNSSERSLGNILKMTGQRLDATRAAYVFGVSQTGVKAHSVFSGVAGEYRNCVVCLLQCGLLEGEPDQRVVAILEIGPLDHHH